MKIKSIWSLLAVPAALFLLVGRADCLSVQKEEELGREFMKVVFERYHVIEDPLITDYVEKVGRHIVSVFPNRVFNYQFYVLKEPVYNAFAAPAGHVFINSGLFEAMDSEEELAGILAHEIAHVECRHISQKIERSSKISMLTLAGLAAGIFLGAGGADTAASALTIGSMAAGQSLELSYSREDEMEADQLGLTYLYKAGYSAAGLLDMLKKIRQTEWFGTDIIPTYLRTHPASEDRIAYIGTRLDTADPPSAKKPTTETEFQIAHTRLTAVYGDADTAVNRFTTMLEKNPGDPQAHYGLALVFDRKGNRRLAQAHLKKALASNPLNPYFLSDLGRIYFLNGQYQDALTILKDSVYVVPDNYTGLFFLGRSELELEEYEKAVDAFEQLIRKKPDYEKAHYFLGQAYGKMGRLADAHYHLGCYYKDRGEARNATFHFERAAKKTEDPEKREEIGKILDEMHTSAEKAGAPMVNVNGHPKRFGPE
ncbi:MAG: M48 family metalloprotease [Desulfobacterales bacterium]